jgi:MinD superfamily P-loop ATPase
MERVVDVAKHFGIHTKVIINKYDINLDNTRTIRKICQTRNIDVLAQLPFTEDVTKALIAGMPIVEFCKNQITKEIVALWEKI